VQFSGVALSAVCSNCLKQLFFLKANESSLLSGFKATSAAVRPLHVYLSVGLYPSHCGFWTAVLSNSSLNGRLIICLACNV